MCHTFMGHVVGHVSLDPELFESKVAQVHFHHISVVSVLSFFMKTLT